MKRIAGFLTAAAVMLSMTACGDGKSSSSADQRVNGTGEEAFREYFSSVYSANGRERYYCYTFPAVAVDKLKADKKYDSAVKQYNDGQGQFLGMISHSPEITEITGTVDFGEDETAAAEKYFVKVTRSQLGFDISADEFTVTKGVEISCNFNNYNGNADTDVECMAYIEGDGWKNIPCDIETLMDNFGENASQGTT